MRTPIQAALCFPDRPAGCSRQLDWTRLSRLDFAPPDTRRFPAIDLAYRVMRADNAGVSGGACGGASGGVFNAANEAAVAAFLEHRIPFGRIVELVAAALDAFPALPADTLDDILDADQQARAFVEQQLEDPAIARR